MTAPLQVLQISDSHLLVEPHATLLGVNTTATLDAVLTQALAEQAADALIASGDLAHEPSAVTYRRVHDIVRRHFAGPVLYLPGNHDHGAPLRAELGSVAALRLGAWEIIGFDSHVDDRAEAALGAAARTDLERRIRASDAAHVLLTCHHPPLPVGCPWLDKDCIPAGSELLESCAAAGGHPSRLRSRVRGLVFGHVHQEVAHQEVRTAHGDVAVLGTPSTCFQFEPASRRFSIDRHDVTGRPGYRWLELHDGGALNTRVGRLRGTPLNIDLHDRS